MRSISTYYDVKILAAVLRLSFYREAHFLALHLFSELLICLKIGLPSQLLFTVITIVSSISCSRSTCALDSFLLAVYTHFA